MAADRRGQFAVVGRRSAQRRRESQSAPGGAAKTGRDSAVLRTGEGAKGHRPSVRVVIGSKATPMRNWRSNPVIGLLLVAVAMGAAWLTYQNVRKPSRGVEYSYVLKCTNAACGRIFVKSYPAGQQPPFPCRFCGSPSYPAYKCRAKGHIFPLMKGSSTRPSNICPYCGSRGYPLDPGQIPAETESPSP